MKEILHYTNMVIQQMHSIIILLVVVAVVFDTIFGVIRAIKERKFNSCFGIDGAIRKISMVISLLGLSLVDCLIHINLIGFIPENVRVYFGEFETIGTAEFFGILYIAYEVVSILKNMYLCGLPVKRIWNVVRKFLLSYTDELPDADEIEGWPEAKYDADSIKITGESISVRTSKASAEGLMLQQEGNIKEHRDM